MFRFVPVNGAAAIPDFVAGCLRKVGDVVRTPYHEYCVVKYVETVVVRVPRHRYDTSAALVVARAIDNKEVSGDVALSPGNLVD